MAEEYHFAFGNASTKGARIVINKVSSELKEYITDKYNYSDELVNKIVDYVSSPYQVDLVNKYEPEEFMSFIDKVRENMAFVNISNALKVSQKLRLKDEEDGYDFELFLKGLYISYYKNASNDIRRSQETLKLLINCMNEAKNISFNKQYIFDTLVMGVQKIWNY